MINWFISRFSEVGSIIAGIASWFGDLSADVFWAILTSHAAIAVLGAIAAAAFVVSHVPAIAQRFFPSLMLYAQAAAKVCLVASAMVMFAFGYRVADGRAEIERLKVEVEHAKNDLAWSEFQLDQQRKIAEAADELRKRANAEKEAAQGKLNDFISKFGTNPTDPPPGVVDELRRLQRNPVRRASAKSRAAERAAVARMRALVPDRQ